MFLLEFQKDGSKELIPIPDNYRNVIDIELGGSDFSSADRRTIIRQDRLSRKLFISSSIGNVMPLFWAWGGRGKLLLGSSAAAVFRASQDGLKIGGNTFDLVGIVESWLFDGPLGSRTLLENVNKTQMGERLTFDFETQSVERDWHWLPTLETLSDPGLDGAKAIADKAFDALYANTEKLGDEYLLPLTGGFDSRFLASLLTKRPRKLRSYTFQRGWSLETFYARKIASKLGIEHRTLELGPDCYGVYAREVALSTGGMISGMHTHGLYCCEKLLPENWRGLGRIFGYFGDPVTGAMSESEEQGMMAATPEGLFNKYAKSFYPEIIENFRDEILHDIRECYKNFEKTGSPQKCFHEFWKIQQRQNNLINHLFSEHRNAGVVVEQPFVLREFVEPFLSLPYRFRHGRVLFKEQLVRKFPNVAPIGSTHFYPKSMLARLESIFELTVSIANRLKRNQRFIVSPFKYEQHEKTLEFEICNDIERGLDAVSELFGVEAKKAMFPAWKYSTTKEYYRFAGLGYLVDGIKKLGNK